jgi:amino acid transporter
MSGTDASPEMRRNALSFVSVITQSVAHMGPSAAIALFVGLVVGDAGASTWLTFAVSTVIILIVAYCISHFTRRLASTGDLYGFATKGGGAGAGLLTAWAQLLFGIVTAAAGVIIFGLYFGQLMNTDFGISQGRGMLMVWFALCAFGAAYLTYRDVRLSARFMFCVELISLVLIGILLVITVVKNIGSIFDSTQLGLSGFSVHHMLIGAVLVIFAFSGFESASIFGQEARDPTRTITRAILWSVGVCGVLFVIASYIMVLGFTGTKYDLATSASPLVDLSKINGVSFLQYPVLIGVSISIFSVVVAVTNSTSRLVFTLGREGLLPRAATRVSNRHKTPIGGIVVMLVINLVTAVYLVLSNNATESVYGYLSSFAGYGAILAYLIVSLAAIGWLRKLGVLRPVHVLASLVAAAALIYVYYENLVPQQPSPYDWLLYGFFAAALAAVAVYGILLATGSPALGRVGSSVDEDTAQIPLEDREPSAAVASVRASSVLSASDPQNVEAGGA